MKKTKFMVDELGNLPLPKDGFSSEFDYESFLTPMGNFIFILEKEHKIDDVK